MVLARCLDSATFGEYRLLWLAIGTVMALAPLNMPHSLFFFLPRSSPPQKRLYVHQVILFLALAGALSALGISALNPWLPATLHRLAVYDPLVPLLVAIWVPAYLLDVLPLVDERVRWQASVTIALAAVRTALLALAAMSGDLGVMLMVLVALALAKLALILWYVRSHYGLDGEWIEKRAFADHLSHSLPIGLWATLFQLRGQADQWIAATRFTLHSFAAFSIAALLSPLVTLCRQAVSEAFFPSMSRVQASGDAAGMLALNAGFGGGCFVFFAASVASFSAFCSSFVISRAVGSSSLAPVRNIIPVVFSAPLFGLYLMTPNPRSATVPPAS